MNQAGTGRDECARTNGDCHDFRHDQHTPVRTTVEDDPRPAELSIDQLKLVVGGMRKAGGDPSSSGVVFLRFD